MPLDAEQERLRQSRGPLARALGVSSNAKAVRCPFHNDKNPSASIHHDGDGAWRFHCFTCDWRGDVFDVIARKQGRELGDVLNEAKGESMPESKPEPKPQIFPTLEKLAAIFPDVEKVYSYTNPETQEIDMAVIRYRRDEEKKFAQASPLEGGWILKAPQGKLPLYNRTRVRESETVIVVEGEKAVHALAAIGIVATTSPGGAGKASKADWSPLTGKSVYLWPDHDSPDAKTGMVKGVQHMKDVQAILETLDCKLFWIDPASLDLPAKGDAVEFIVQNGGTKEDRQIAVKLMLDEAMPLGAARELEERFEAIISGKWVNLEWPWREMTYEAQALLPDTVTALCGDPGAAKSFLLLEAFWHWHLAGEKVALYELEDDRAYHLTRALAQLEHNAHLTDLEWVKANPEKVRASMANQRDVITSLGRIIYDAPDKNVTLDQLADWFEDRCKEGASVCGIDPVTAAQVSDKPWIDDQKFIFRVKAIAKKYHSRLIYCIHPRVSNGKVGPSLSRMAGGAAYARFSHSVFWLTRHDLPVTNEVYSSDFGRRMVTYERTMKISKARNGPGAGQELAFHLNNGLCFDEHGSVVPESKVSVPK